MRALPSSSNQQPSSATMNDTDVDKRSFFLSQTLHGTIRLCAYRVKESTQAGQRDRDLQSHQPVPSGSCPFSRTTTCGHCHWDWAVPQARASSFQKIKHFTDSHKLSTATAEWRCLTPSLATGPRLVASAHSNTLPRTGIIQEYLARNSRPNCRRTSPELSRRRLMRQYIRGVRCREIQ